MLSKLQLPVKLEKRGGCLTTDPRLSLGTHVVYFLGMLGRYSLCCLYPVDRPFTLANLRAYIADCPQFCFFRTISGLGKHVVNNELDGWIWFYTNDPSAGANNDRVISPFRTTRMEDGVKRDGPGFINRLPRFMMDAILERANNNLGAVREILEHYENDELAYVPIDAAEDSSDDESSSAENSANDVWYRVPAEEEEGVVVENNANDIWYRVPAEEEDVVDDVVVQDEEEDGFSAAANEMEAANDVEDVMGEFDEMEESDVMEVDQDDVGGPEREVDQFLEAHDNGDDEEVGGDEEVVQRQPTEEPDHSDSNSSSDIVEVIDIDSEDNDDLVRAKLASSAFAFITKCLASGKGRKRARLSCRAD